MTGPRLAVLASGGGTNLQAIIDHLASLGAAAPGVLALVISDRENAGALERARDANIAAMHIPYAPDGTALTDALAAHKIDAIALAGYLRLIPPIVTTAYTGRIVNIHPALLPAFGGPGMYGRRVHEAVLAAGARESGATVHHVDDVYDHGTIIEQERVPVFPRDTVDRLADRVLEVEHRIYPRAVVRLLQQIGKRREDRG